MMDLMDHVFVYVLEYCTLDTLDSLWHLTELRDCCLCYSKKMQKKTKHRNYKRTQLTHLANGCYDVLSVSLCQQFPQCITEMFTITHNTKFKTLHNQLRRIINESLNKHVIDILLKVYEQYDDAYCILSNVRNDVESTQCFKPFTEFLETRPVKDIYSIDYVFLFQDTDLFIEKYLHDTKCSFDLQSYSEFWGEIDSNLFYSLTRNIDSLAKQSVGIQRNIFAIFDKDFSFLDLQLCCCDERLFYLSVCFLLASEKNAIRYLKRFLELAPKQFLKQSVFLMELVNILEKHQTKLYFDYEGIDDFLYFIQNICPWLELELCHKQNVILDVLNLTALAFHGVAFCEQFKHFSDLAASQKYFKLSPTNTLVPFLMSRLNLQAQQFAAKKITNLRNVHGYVLAKRLWQSADTLVSQIVTCNQTLKATKKNVLRQAIKFDDYDDLVRLLPFAI